MSISQPHTNSAVIRIGPHTTPNRAFLAPMSGVSDLPFRKLAARFGAGLVVSEMIASESLVNGDAESALRAEGPDNGLHVVQLAGREAHWMAAAAKVAVDAGADVVDINMGCPAKKVTSGYSGSALMRDLDHALTLIEATVEAADVPVTLKMRLGWDDTSLNAPELARRAEDAGVRMITVHGRTRCQFYKGRADWSAIRNVVQEVTVPVIANGDCESFEAAEDMLRQSGADGVMIGRGAYGRPWFPGAVGKYLKDGTRLQAPVGVALGELIIEHYEAILAHYGEGSGLRIARKHLGWYFDEADKSQPVPKRLRQEIMTSKSPGDITRWISNHFNQRPEQTAA